LTPSFLLNSSISLAVFFASCQSPKNTKQSLDPSTISKIAQGVHGKVVFKEGEFSTSGELLNNGKVYGVSKMVYFYELTSIKDASFGETGFVYNIATEVIDSVSSDKNGNFFKELPAGIYSIFIKEVERYYSKLDDKDYFTPVTVSPDATKSITLEIDYKASYISPK